MLCVCACVRVCARVRTHANKYLEELFGQKMACQAPEVTFSEIVTWGPKMKSYEL